MNTKPISIRIEIDLIENLDKYAKQHEWTRNYLIHKILKERMYELIRE